MLNLNYDKKYDVLYLSFNSTENSFGNEEIPGIVILKDIITKSITGVTFFGFKEKYREHRLPNLSLPKEINYEKIYKIIQN